MIQKSQLDAPIQYTGSAPWPAHHVALHLVKSQPEVPGGQHDGAGWVDSCDGDGDGDDDFDDFDDFR